MAPLLLSPVVTPPALWTSLPIAPSPLITSPETSRRERGAAATAPAPPALSEAGRAPPRPGGASDVFGAPPTLALPGKRRSSGERYRSEWHFRMEDPFLLRRAL